ASRMMKYSHFETELHLRFPKNQLFIRNMADEGNTPAFRPHPGRKMQFAFPGGEKFYRKYISGKSGPWTSGATGHFETPDQWLTRLKPDTIIAFFGFNSSFRGEAGVATFKEELDAFIDHTLTQKYNGVHVPQLAVVSPTAVQNLSATHHTPTGETQNHNLALYTQAMKEVCAENGIMFIDLFSPSKAVFDSATEPLTIDGALLNSKAYQWLAGRLADDLYGKASPDRTHQKLVHSAVKEKNWMWHNHFKIPNGVHVYGRRYNPYGPKNYPFELKKVEEMTANRDWAIWRALEGKRSSLKTADSKTSKLPEVPTNYKPSRKNGKARYLTGKETLKHLAVPDGYKIELFADEQRFPELANPVQMSFDNKGRLWVACMPSYPHWKPGDPKPKDKLIIFEDTNNDGRADKRTVFYDGLHLSIGFELAPEGVYVSQADSLILLTDKNGDDKADGMEYLISGFDDHDTHHAISAFCADPSGAIYMGEGVFLHSNVETVYGPQRGTNGGFFRYNPKRRHLERTAQLHIPNPWGTAFDKWGQNFFLHTSGTTMNWMMPGTVKPMYGQGMNASRDLISSNKVRPTSGLEFVSSRHFPEDVQGDLLLCNNIGFLGIKQHKVEEDGTGFKTTFRHDLLKSSEGNFRPVDLEFAPDGSLYIIDWSNVLIGHMQHNARDPHRDHVHGRIYRITYPSRPLVKPAKIAGAPIAALLENLKIYEDCTRYRTRRELRGRDSKQVLAALKQWTSGLDKADPNYEHHLLEALWVSWGHDQIDQSLLAQLLQSKDHKVRSAAVRAVRYNGHQLANQPELLKKAAQDSHGRVRLEAIAAASWINKTDGLAVLDLAEKAGIDNWMKGSLNVARSSLNNTSAIEKKEKIKVPSNLLGQAGAGELYKLGKEVYHRDAHCATCHQADGKGLPEAQFPPVAGTKWATQDIDRMIKLTLKGLNGEIEVQGKKYNGSMTPFEGLLNDKEVAAVLTYVRNSFGNKARVVKPEQVKAIRASMKGKPDLLNAAELLKQHPHK
ncbi:MAG: PVC-type heme-binding CxxCH protein, partial [Akkermansiaceae bacterium]